MFHEWRTYGSNARQAPGTPYPPRGRCALIQEATSSLTKDLNGKFLLDFRTSTLSINGTALLRKVLVDFRPRCYSGAGFRALRDRAAQNWPFGAQWEPHGAKPPAKDVVGGTERYED